MNAANCPLDVLGLVFAAVQPPSARKRLPEVCKHWHAAFNSSAVLWSDVRADFARLTDRLPYGFYHPISPSAAATAEFNRRAESLAAWLERRASLVRSLHIDWPSRDGSLSLPGVLQQPMPRLTSLTILCSNGSTRGNADPSERLADVACLASHQTQLTALVFGRRALPVSEAREAPATAWINSLQRLRHLGLPGFYLAAGTAAALSQLSGLSLLDLAIDAVPAQRSLQAALRQLCGLTSLSATLPEWPRPHPADQQPAYQQDQERFPSLDVGVLGRLAALRLTYGGVRGLSAAAPALTWLHLDEAQFEMEDLLGCSRLVGLEAKLHCFNACLDRYMYCQLQPGCLPALRTLSLRALAGDAQHEAPGFLAQELSALTGLTSLAVQGPAVVLLTQQQCKEQRWQDEEWCTKAARASRTAAPVIQTLWKGRA